MAKWKPLNGIFKHCQRHNEPIWYWDNWALPYWHHWYRGGVFIIFNNTFDVSHGHRPSRGIETIWPNPMNAHWSDKKQKSINFFFLKMAFGNTYCNQLGSDASTFFCLFMLSIVYCLSFIVLLQIKEIPEGFSLLLLLCRCCCWSKLANFSNKNFPAMCETFTTCVVNNGKYLKTGQFARWSKITCRVSSLSRLLNDLTETQPSAFFVSIFEQDRAGGRELG